MGILKHLLFWPVTGPKFLFDFSMSKVMGVVQEELTDDNAVKAELLELQLKLELGDIDDDEYLRQEPLLMQKLRDIRHWKEEFGMGVSGGPVRVAAAEDEGEGEGEGETDASAEGVSAAPGASGGVVDASQGAVIELNFDDWHQ